MAVRTESTPQKPARTLNRDLKILARFVDVYCRGLHGDRPRRPFSLRTVDLSSMGMKPIELCADCMRLLSHALVKRLNCPMDPKPACKHCPKHCYHPEYRERMRAVMRYSGKKLVLTGRIDYLLKLLF